MPLRLAEHVYIVGSGQLGLSSPQDCHHYLIASDSEYVLIDAGSGDSTSRQSLQRNLKADGLEYERIRHILLTHYHCDHSGGAAWIKADTGAKVYISGRERELVESGTRKELALDWYPADYLYNHCTVDYAFSRPTEYVQIGPLSVLAIATPGHSHGGTCYLVEIDGLRILFSGDTVYFGGIIGLLNFHGSDLSEYREALPRLHGLNVDALLPGHFMFTMRNGQAHVDKAIAGLKNSLFVPYSVGQLGLFS